ETMKLKLKKGDLVQVIAGNDKGAVGRILELYPDKMRVLVEGVNVRKKHTRPTQQNPKGGIISKEMPIHYSNVMILDSDKNPTRIGIRFEEKDGKIVKVRYSKKNGKDL
ncbi:MAG: 50S ribosomal protein L24, partial [Candidatus Kapaibacteriota bacterium]